MYAMNGKLGSKQVTLVLVAWLTLSGCSMFGGKKSLPPPGSGTGSSTGSPTQAQAVKVSEGGDLSEISKALKTKEDQWVLDLMLGYRMLLLRSPDPKALDKETLNRSRDAYDRLETILRHGGVKAKEEGERVYSITSEDRLSLQEVIQSASQAAQKAAKEGDVEKARARWKDIAMSKPAVTYAMEEAQWGLTFSDAMQANLPDSLKRKLKEVNESYFAEIGHEEIGKQVKALLEIVPEVKLQRELKKLANRAWERDKKAGRNTTQSQQAPTVAAGTVPAPGPQDAVPQNGSAPGSAPATDPASANQPPSGEAIAIAAEADSLAAKGKYVAAMKALERGGAEQSWVKDRKVQIGNRFCEEKRRSAANAFKDFKKAAADSVKRTFLMRTASDLDSCLFYFPELSVSQKVRKNREMVEGEMKKLKP